MSIKTISKVEKELKLEILGDLLKEAKLSAERNEIDYSDYSYIINEFELDIDDLLVRLFTERLSLEKVKERIKKSYKKEINQQLLLLDLSDKVIVAGIINTLDKFIKDLGGV